MATYINDTFTGTNGAAWSGTYWTSAMATAGSTATIQSNKGRLNTGTLTNWAGQEGMRYSGSTTVADTEFVGTFTFPNSAEVYFYVEVRSGSTFNGTNCYSVYFDGTTCTFDKAVATVGTNFSSKAFAPGVGVAFGVRLRAVGTTIQYRAWTGTEPGTWDTTVTDSSVANGSVGVLAIGGAAAGGIVDVDDVLVTDGAAAAGYPFGITTPTPRYR